MNTLGKFLLVIMITALVTGCASLQMAELDSGNNPEQAVAEVTQLMIAAQQDQLDVLADDEFSKGSFYLRKAKRGLRNESGAEELSLSKAESIVSNAAVAKAFFLDARKNSEPRKSAATRILAARKSALDAGVRKNDKLVANMVEIDGDLVSETKQFSRSLSPENFARFQKEYLVLEAKAVQFRELDIAKQEIDKAISNDAEDIAPKSLRAASLDYKTSLNIIFQSPRSPAVYKKSVDEALTSATQLRDVMNIILAAKGTPEQIAEQIVEQKRALGNLNSSLQTTKKSLQSIQQSLQSTEQSLQEKSRVVGELSSSLQTTQQSLQSTQQSLQEKEGTLKQTQGILKSQEEQLARASTQVRFQQAMDEARKVLSKDDALVYQQGNKLVFRIKRINFKSGTAIIPESSKQLIVKIDSIIKNLDAEKVVVQGHTDSVGSAEVNKKLSKQRAAAVANYLFSLQGGYKMTYAGYGESSPLVSNDTPEGRATNRRVDLVLSVKQ